MRLDLNAKVAIVGGIHKGYAGVTVAFKTRADGKQLALVDTGSESMWVNFVHLEMRTVAR